MVQIVKLSKGQRLPAGGRKKHIVEIAGDRATESVSDDPRKFVHRVPADRYEETMALLNEKYAAHPDAVIYVRDVRR